jgi:hypothetical protein
MIVTEARKVCDDTRIDVLCYEPYETDYGAREKHWIYSDQCRSKEQAIKNINDWVERIKTYAKILKEQVENLE